MEARLAVRVLVSMPPRKMKRRAVRIVYSGGGVFGFTPFSPPRTMGRTLRTPLSVVNLFRVDGSLAERVNDTRTQWEDQHVALVGSARQDHPICNLRLA